MALGRSVVSLARRAVVFEIGIWRSLGRWVARRPSGVGKDREAFGYARSATPLIWVFIIVSAIEIPVAHVVLPWELAKTASLAVGVWGLMWMFGFLASLHVYPHVAGPEGLRLRNGVHVDVTLPWDAIRSVSTHRRDMPSQRSVQLVETDAGTILHLVQTSETSVDIVLSRPLEVHLRSGSVTVTQVRVHADEPRALVARVRSRLTQSPQRR
jgi:hypothetical protein